MTIKCKDQELYPFHLKKFGRVKRIFFDNRGLAYYRRGNMRTYLTTEEFDSIINLCEKAHIKMMEDNYNAEW